MKVTRIHCPVAILGGGITGLMTLALARKKQIPAYLFEIDALGTGQTIASQGIIHAGRKYLLQKRQALLAKQTAQAATYWQDCFDGRGSIDLHQITPASNHYYLLAEASWWGRLKMMLATLILQKNKLHHNQLSHPLQLLRQTGFRGSIEAIPEIVLNVTQLLQELRRQCLPYLFQLPKQVDYHYDRFQRLELHGQSFQLTAASWIYCCGKHNQTLNPLLSKQAMQIRPLQMLWVNWPVTSAVPAIYVHLIGNSSLPLVTITSHQHAKGHMVWYLGGQLAEVGCHQSAAEQIAAAKVLLARTFPNLPISQASWHRQLIERAEANYQGKRPDSFDIIETDPDLTIWPTKLTLAPLAAESCIERLQKKMSWQAVADPTRNCFRQLRWEAPRVASLIWDTDNVASSSIN